MAAWERRLQLRYPFPGARPYLLDEERLRRWIEALDIQPRGVHIEDVQPGEAYPGTAMVIVGFNFSENRADNLVKVGGEPAFVVEASENRLFVLTDVLCGTGPVEVTVGGDTALAPIAMVLRIASMPGPVRAISSR